MSVVALVLEGLVGVGLGVGFFVIITLTIGEVIQYIDDKRGIAK